VKVRFFGSAECRDCLQIFVWLEKYGVSYDYFDGHDIENDDVYNMCEEQNVDELPHLQIIDNSEKVLFEHVGPMTEKSFISFVGGQVEK
jgi:hypothetical protein